LSTVFFDFLYAVRKSFSHPTVETNDFFFTQTCIARARFDESEITVLRKFVLASVPQIGQELGSFPRMRVGQKDRK